MKAHIAFDGVRFWLSGIALGASPWIANENSVRIMNSLPLKGKAQRRGGWGTGGRKVREEMRIKQAIYGSSQAPVFVNGAPKKWHSSHQSLEAPNP